MSPARSGELRSPDCYVSFPVYFSSCAQDFLAIGLAPLRVEPGFYERRPELHGIGRVENHALPGQFGLQRAVEFGEVGAFLDGAGIETGVDQFEQIGAAGSQAHGDCR